VCKRPRIIAFFGYSRQQADIFGELGGVLQGESGSTFLVSGHDQRCYLDDLALTPCVRAGVLLRAGDVPLRGRPVAALGGREAQTGVLDRVHRDGLSQLSLGVMPPDCAGRLTRS
jgi:hypothetical protein